MNYFDLFELPIGFVVDKSALKQRYLTLQKQYHPDATDDGTFDITSDKLNAAFDVLCSDDKRALYLLQLQGVDINLDETIDDPAFLNQMMALRIALEEAKDDGDLPTLAAVGDELQSLQKQTAEQFCVHYQNFAQEQAILAAVQLKFLARLKTAWQETSNSIACKQNAFDDDDLYV